MFLSVPALFRRRATVLQALLWSIAAHGSAGMTAWAVLAALGILGDLLYGQRIMSQRIFERVRRIELELDNMRAALTWLSTTGRTIDLQRLAGDARVLAKVFQPRGD